MTELLSMSRKELDRFSLLSQVMAKKMTQAKAAQLLELSDRQVRNLVRSLHQFGPKGLISKKRGQPSNRRSNPNIRHKVMDLIRKNYSDFAPTLATEKLWENHQLRISRETLRQWMIAGHLWIPKLKKRKLHLLRPPREYFGEMFQGDGSHHDWFETVTPVL